jgi:uncharacterized protein YqjF (DUF2071 family)
MSLLSDFNYEILKDVAHRPYPMPQSPWIMTQTWHDLLFAHWPVDRTSVASKLPPGVELELFDNQAWVGIVPFRMTNVAPRAVPALPWVSAFPELNVRTYARVGPKSGVYFFSLDAGNPLAVVAARNMFHLPYFSASMDVKYDDGTISYASRRMEDEGPRAEFAATYRPSGEVFQAAPGTLEHFLIERYCLFTTDHSGHLYTVDIHHPPWPLQNADAAIATNTMADAAGLRLPSMAPLLHFTKRQDMVAWPLSRVNG